MNELSFPVPEGIIFSLLVALVLGAAASFFAIVSWTRTRHLSWTFAIVGILASYAGTLYRALRSFGLFSGPQLMIYGVPLGTLISDNVPMLFLLLACVFYIRENR